MFQQILFLGFVLSTVIQLIYWMGIFQRPFGDFRAKSGGVVSPVSVIICAKDEAVNLRKNLPKILSQDYPDFEVIVVNDHSVDDSWDILTQLRKTHDNLKIVNFTATKLHIGKKEALTIGIQSATNDWLLMTDADCAPVSKDWITSMMVTQKEQKQIGLGYSPYSYAPSFLNAFIRYETLLTAFQYLSLAAIKRPYMGVGRNLLYRKELFRQAGGFEKHQHIASGDDDLFIREVANGTNVAIVMSSSSVVYSAPQNEWKAWFRQKKRHLSTGTQYDTNIQLLLGFFSFSHFFFTFSCVLLLIIDFGTVVVLASYVFRTLIIVLMCTRFRKNFQEVNDWYWIPILDFLYPFYYLIMTPYLISTKTQSWK